MTLLKKITKLKVATHIKIQKIPLAVGYHKKEVFVLEKIIHGEKEPHEYELAIIRGQGNSLFSGKSEPINLVRTDHRGKKIEENIAHCHDFKFFCHGDEITLAYIRKGVHGPEFAYAGSDDLVTWVVGGTVPEVRKPGILVPELEDGAGDIIYSNGATIEAAISENLRSWKVVFPARTPHWDFFDGLPFNITGALALSKKNFADGILLFYESRMKSDIFIDDHLHNKKVGEDHYVKIGAALFSKKEPTKLLWQTELPLLELAIESEGQISFLGVIPHETHGTISSAHFYFADKNGKIHFFEFSLEHLADHRNRPKIKVIRAHENPILKPTLHGWESEGVFNPAVLRLGGKVHLLYRAVGNDGWSRVGHATSIDGIHIDERSKKPVYSLHKHELPDLEEGEDVSLFSSGGSWGGCEDPKATHIDGRVYMTFVAHDGGWPMRTAITSISEKNFLNKKWAWKKPELMSPPNVGSKSVVILPEKITDKKGQEMYVVFHRVWPNIMVNLVPKLEFGENKRWLKNEYMIRPRRSYWDSQKLSMGSTPIKTPHGWLCIYSAVDRKDSSKYKIGAMLLDLKKPWIAIARSRKPILEPDALYENRYEDGRGKPGIVYPGGAVDIDGTIHIYYGGADIVTCVATISTNELVENLLKNRPPQLKIIPCS